MQVDSLRQRHKISPATHVRQSAAAEVQYADTWVAGRVLGADALAAVGSSYTLMVFLTSILLGLCMGSGVAISMQYGKRAQDSMRRSVFMSFLLIPQIGVTGIWVSVPIGWALADLIGFAAMRWHTLL